MDMIGRTAFINLEKIPCLALHCGGSAADATPMDEATPYACPTCGAEYKVVRVEAKTMVPEGRLTCTKCGGPLHAREGRHILKYFLVGGSRRYPLRPRSRS
jgi:predicted RNA-binding Zn-ribbon protein involved in translation (DUF1610 family)